MAADDLKYPEGLIASPYVELQQSTLKVGVGSMPGKPLQEIDEDRLVSGRGVIP